jgi:hypothetical protein
MLAPFMFAPLVLAPMVVAMPVVGKGGGDPADGNAQDQGQADAQPGNACHLGIRLAHDAIP